MPLMLTLLLGLLLLGQTGSGSARAAAATHETPHLTIATSVQPAAAGKTRLSVLVTPKPKMHVYAPGQDGFIAVTLSVQPQPGVTAGAPVYPTPEKLVIPSLNETQLVYAKPFRIDLDLATSRKPAGTIIKGSLKYQACDNTTCYLPVTVPVEWTLK